MIYIIIKCEYNKNKKMITNTNGLIDNIYHFLWLKDDSLLKESFKLRVPETLIYKSGCP